MPETPRLETLQQSGQGIVGMNGRMQRLALLAELAMAIDL
jgi:hypothetical protein